MAKGAGLVAKGSGLQATGGGAEFSVPRRLTQPLLTPPLHQTTEARKADTRQQVQQATADSRQRTAVSRRQQVSRVRTAVASRQQKTADSRF